VRLVLYEGYRAFVAAYREAAEKLRAGDRAAIFPAGWLSAGSSVRRWLTTAGYPPPPEFRFEIAVWSGRRGEVYL